MISGKEYSEAQKKAAVLIKKTSILLTDKEFNNIAVADFGLSNLNVFGAQILTLVDTKMIAVKLIAMFPMQTLPEHWHPRIGEYAGKEETLRVEWGEIFIYSPGLPTENLKAVIPEEKRNCFSHWHENTMKAGDQITFAPITPHWFQAGPKGVVVWSFSTKALDLQDEFTDPQIIRETIVVDNI